ncbi:HAD-IA family hydrolase [Oryzibacter oryziterrae]|uniref:HAD-IA family hydrolase n=1 Tax=Oryzibacter oryziterrae TaxID=2766474 RepID=UPI001EFF923C|nr:HAD-IA family hydrolase [Oryzibacter oryziterrae]
MLDIAKSKSLIDKADVVSFDIFDTLIRRSFASPRDVFHHMKGQAHRLSGGLITDFSSIRVHAEKHALESAKLLGVNEVSIDEIYDEIGELTGLKGDVLTALKNLEISTEVECTASRPIGRDLFSYAQLRRKRIILVSDMYLDRNAIERLLAVAGIEHYERIYLSSELRKTKRDGDLFRYILDELHLDASKLIHVGDNSKGDVSVPESLGILTIHLPRSMENFRESSVFGVNLAEAGKKHWSLTKSVVEKLVADRFFDVREDRHKTEFFGGDPFCFGYSALGPLMLGFAFWLFREAKADRTEKLYFLSRDGLIMKRVFDELFPASEYGIETEYLYCSRRMVRVPAMRNRFDLLQPLSRPIHKRSIGNWLEANYGVNVSDISIDIFKRHGFENASTLIYDDVDRGALKALIQECEELFLAVAADERSSLEGYLAASGIGNGRHAVVDIGYAGTMQDALSSFLGRELKGYYLAVFGSSSGGKNQLDLRGFLSQYGSDNNPSLGICTHRFVYESLVCSVEDSTVRIKWDGSAYSPVGQIIPGDDGRKVFVDLAHAGAVAMAKDYREISPVAPELSLLSSEASTMILDSYLRRPMLGDVALLNGITFHDLYGVDEPRFLALAPELRSGVVPARIIWKESLSVDAGGVIQTAQEAEMAARTALAAKQYSIAADAFLAAFKLQPARSNYLRAAAEARYKAKERKVARAHLREYLKINPNNARAKARLWTMRVPFLSMVIGDYEFKLS